ncbi:MAG: heavy-metal-associated domain-containing protein [Spirosomataceae bacterium]
MKKSVLLTLITLIFSGLVMATPPKTAEAKFKTSAVCGMCKKRIERDLGVTKGVVESKLNLDDKVVTITYNPKKTSPDKLKAAISKIGYDADDVMADKNAHDALPDCCKKGNAMHKD